MKRDHRLRARRLKLGVTQYDLGCVAGWPPHNAQSMISMAERANGAPSAQTIRRVREALSYLEAEPRRRRAWQREEQRDLDATEAALRAEPMDEETIVARLISLLCEGRADDFDALAARIPQRLSDEAGEQYLELCKPSVP